MANVNDYLNEEDAESLTLVNTEEVVQEQEVMQRGFALPEWLKAETGPGSIESYVDHPMNFNKSMAVGRILRGLTGMFGSLKYAVIDIVLGVLEMGRKKAPVVMLNDRD
jgi:hypothetical protein